MITTGNDEVGISHLKDLLHSSFKMKDLGKLTYFLGLEVSYGKEGIRLSQQKYAEDLVRLANLIDRKKVHTLVEANTKYKKEKGKLSRYQTLYRRLVLSQFITEPYKMHYTALLGVIRYIKCTVNRSLLFPSSSSLDMVGYADANWAGCPNSRRSTTGWCMMLGSCMISWKCKKQSQKSKSSTEAEYRSMFAACSEIIWLRRLLSELGIEMK
uniref:Reverse transcriptase Ty1/copia-type domain-containing protein n=1 Tax=Solanum lycopersicum TaxID=4081 RepID=A0A3Q7FH00_SOLLC